MNISLFLRSGHHAVRLSLASALSLLAILCLSSARAGTKDDTTSALDRPIPHAVFHDKTGRDPFLPVGYIKRTDQEQDGRQDNNFKPIPPTLTIVTINSFIRQAMLNSGEILKPNHSYQPNGTGAHPPGFKVLKINENSVTILWNGQTLEYPSVKAPTLDDFKSKGPSLDDINDLSSE